MDDNYNAEYAKQNSLNNSTLRILHIYTRDKINERLRELRAKMRAAKPLSIRILCASRRELLSNAPINEGRAFTDGKQLTRSL